MTKSGGAGGPLSFSWLLRQSALGLMSAGSPTLNTRRGAARNPWRQAAVPRQPNGGGKSQISPLKAVLNLSPLVCLDPCNQLEIVTHVQAGDRHLNAWSFSAATEEKELLRSREDSEVALLLTRAKTCKLMLTPAPFTFPVMSYAPAAFNGRDRALVDVLRD